MEYTFGQYPAVTLQQLQQGISSGGLTQNPYQPNPIPTQNAMVAGAKAAQSTLNQPQVLGTSTQAPSGGGGGTTPSAPSGPAAPDDLQVQLDAIFNPQLDILKGQEGSVNQQYGNTVSGITDQYGLSTESLGQANAQGTRELNTQETQAGTRKEDALTSATRLYDELQRGGQQRFGGASSAGEAYQTLTAVEQQRKQGSIQSAYETAMQQVGSLKANLQEKFALATKELEVQKNSALAEAKASFDDGMRQIQAARNQLGSDRATASLNMLQDLRNKVYQINLQALQFTQQLALNNQVSNDKVDQATQYFLQQVGAGQTGVSQFGTQAMNTASATKFGVSAPQANPTLAQTGSISSTRKYDELGNPIA